MSAYISKHLTEDLIKNYDFSKVIYGERAQSGAMGNSGGIVMYVIEDDVLVRYETSIRENEEVAILTYGYIAKNEKYFDIYQGGMGNGVFIMKGLELEIDEDNHSFWHRHDNNKFQIVTSQGIFTNVSKYISGNSSRRIDPIHESWEDGWRKWAKENL